MNTRKVFMLIVGNNPAVLERPLLVGELACPERQGELRPWSAARPCRLREAGAETEITPRCGRCRACKKTHVLSADIALCRRRDTLSCIGAVVGVCNNGNNGRLRRCPATCRVT